MAAASDNQANLEVRIVALTRFRKQRNNERNEVRRAQGALTRFQEGEHR